MTKPIIVDLPHNLGADEAKRRMQEGIGRLEDHIPGGARVQSSWSGNRMTIRVEALAQEVTGHIDVHDRTVHVELMLPAFFSLFAGRIEGLLRSRGGTLLEDKSQDPP